MPKRFLRALANHLALVLSDSRHDVDGESIRIGHIDRDEVDTGFHQARDEIDIAGEAVELGADEAAVWFLQRTRAVASSGRSLFLPLSTSENSTNSSLSKWSIRQVYAANGRRARPGRRAARRRLRRPQMNG